MLLNYHISRFVLGSLCVGDLMRLLEAQIKNDYSFRMQYINEWNT